MERCVPHERLAFLRCWPSSARRRCCTAPIVTGGVSRKNT